jgi:hypothetical protein
MTPIGGRDDPFEAAAAQDVLNAKGDEGRVRAFAILPTAGFVSPTAMPIMACSSH